LLQIGDAGKHQRPSGTAVERAQARPIVFFNHPHAPVAKRVVRTLIVAADVNLIATEK